VGGVKHSQDLWLYQVDDDEEEFSFLLSLLVFFEAPDEVGDLYDGSHLRPVIKLFVTVNYKRS
jgi:hypothetical protein